MVCMEDVLLIQIVRSKTLLDKGQFSMVEIFGNYLPMKPCYWPPLVSFEIKFIVLLLLFCFDQELNGKIMI